MFLYSDYLVSEILIYPGAYWIQVQSVGVSEKGKIFKGKYEPELEFSEG